MSGRLVILRHKSWHVWNQDNREKVLKDERLHEEEVKRKVDVENRLIQEKTYEVLSSVSRPVDVEGATGCTEDGDGDGDGEGGSNEPFRLFGDIEQQALLAKKSSENAEYVAEKLKSEQLKRKREGVEPWLLGDGSHEIKKNKPWYEVVKKEQYSSDQNNIDAGGSSSSGSRRRAEDKSQTNPATAREMKRKDRTDPMHSFLNPKIDFLFMQGKVKEEPDQLSVVVKKECIDDDGVIDPDEKNYERTGTHDDIVEKKEEERDHDSRHHRHHKHRKEHKSRKSKSKSSRDNKLNGQNDADDDALDSNRDRVWDAIRKERLEREAIERKRSAVLLAKRDIYGGQTTAVAYDRYDCSESYGYGQQYHPHLAKTYQR